MIGFLRAASLAGLLLPTALWIRLLGRNRRTTVVCGTVPLVNYGYWARAIAKGGRKSVSLVSHVYAAYRKEDFDLTYDDIVPSWVPARLRAEAGVFFAMKYIMENASALVCSYWGGPLGMTPLWRIEAYLLHWLGIRLVAAPFGGDVYMYSRILDPSVQNVMLACYPDFGRREDRITAKVSYWSRHLDFAISGWIIDGRSRWDILVPAAMLCVDIESWAQKPTYSDADGTNGDVLILHTSNHPDYTGTEFLIDAVESLQAEGLKIDFRNLRGVTNQTIRDLQQVADIRVDGLLFTGYGLAPIEGMAAGLPVVCNLHDGPLTTLFRRYTFFNECPLVSATPETVKDVLRALVVQPALREELGRLSRKYVEKYHSYDAAAYLFDRVLRKVVDGEDIDVRNTFHPLRSEFNRRTPAIVPPLDRNRLPDVSAR